VRGPDERLVDECLADLAGQLRAAGYAVIDGGV